MMNTNLFQTGVFDTVKYADLFKLPPKSTVVVKRLKVGDRVSTPYGEGTVATIVGHYVGVKADNGTTYGFDREEL